MIIVNGTITKRRSLGKHLAFAEIQTFSANNEPVDDIERNNIIPNYDILKVAFRRASPTWNKEYDETFPSKASSLPYGAHVSMKLKKRLDLHQTNQAEVNAKNKINHDLWEVHSWNILRDPRTEATKAATIKDEKGRDNGILCSTYLKIRANSFLDHNSHNPDSLLKVERKGHQQNDTQTRITISNKKKSIKDLKSNSTTSQTSPNIDNAVEEDLSHGDKKAKALRAKIFAAWLINTFGIEHLSKPIQNESKQNKKSAVNSGILDIAGGKGQLSIELSILGQLSCTVIDPLLRKHGKHFLPRDIKRMKKVEGPIPAYISKPFYAIISIPSNDDSQDNDDQLMIKLVQNSTCLVGLHPDECTEDILDMALKYNKSFAIVPCCVFPSLFPMRYLHSGKIVRSYYDFMQYLLEKDDRLKMEALPFQGKNQVIYFNSNE